MAEKDTASNLDQFPSEGRQQALDRHYFELGRQRIPPHYDLVEDRDTLDEIIGDIATRFDWPGQVPTNEPPYLAFFESDWVIVLGHPYLQRP